MWRLIRRELGALLRIEVFFLISSFCIRPFSAMTGLRIGVDRSCLPRWEMSSENV